MLLSFLLFIRRLPLRLGMLLHDRQCGRIGSDSSWCFFVLWLLIHLSRRFYRCNSYRRHIEISVTILARRCVIIRRATPAPNDRRGRFWSFASSFPSKLTLDLHDLISCQRTLMARDLDAEVLELIHEQLAFDFQLTG
jgi:hypothetical protein